MALTLKDYQKKALGTDDTEGALSCFFELARGANSADALQAAFNATRQRCLGDYVQPLPYHPLSKDLPTVPQVCVRIPTGGGKTLLATHAIERAARLYVGVTHPVVLWLVPSNTIRAQTRDALRQPDHPYYQALREYWAADALLILDIDEAEQLRVQDFGSKTIILIATMQTLRVDKTSSRDVYAHKECYKAHFASLTPAQQQADFFARVTAEDLAAQPYLQTLLGQAGIGTVKYSLANWLAWQRPIVVVDEAHNHTTPLSFEVFKRLRPSCVMEWSATPAPDQNVLYHVSAQELKSEHMIKLPIVLTPHPNWQEAVRDAVLARQRLADAALGEPDYVRPIVLFQAEAKGGAVTVEVLKQYLQDSLHIDARRIAVATGTQRELDRVNLFARDCSIEFVITIEALKEGWDCSFAYVFCTVQNIRSAKDMEQLLGRVLRLPYAREPQAAALNRAYAQVCASNTLTVAGELTDRLVAMGFEEMEAASLVQTDPNLNLFDQLPPDSAPALPLEAQTCVELAADLAQLLHSRLTQTAPQAILISPSSASVSETSNAHMPPLTVTVRGVLPQAAIEDALAAVPKKARVEVEKFLERHQARALQAQSPAQRGQPFGGLPLVGVMVQGQLLLLEPDLLNELGELDFATLPADLPGFSEQADEKPFLIDVERGQLRIAQDKASYQLDLNGISQEIRREDVLFGLTKVVRHSRLTQLQMSHWLGRVLDGLLARGLTLTYCARHINRLNQALLKRLRTLGLAAQASLFKTYLALEDQEDGALELSSVYEFHYDPLIYPARSLFQGRYTFSKHYYALPGELDSDLQQEETACAVTLDLLPEVAYWVRNLERQPQHSFWLPTSSDRFYPDFVARLQDARMLVVEYKGAHLYNEDDAREKRDIGAVWAKASGGRCCFVMVTHPKLKQGVSVKDQIKQALCYSISSSKGHRAGVD